MDSSTAHTAAQAHYTLRQQTALVVAGGTGGHIFPGLAVAHALRDAGWSVHWLGAPQSMESRLVPQHDIPFESIAFSGVRGKGLAVLLKAPWRMARAIAQARAVLLRLRPDVVVCFGGYITAPLGLAAAWCGIPIVLHEQNAVAGMANRMLAHLAQRVFTAFPDVFAPTAQQPEHSNGKVQWVGNPLRTEFLTQPEPLERFASRTGPLRLLVMGGSLGAQALNNTVPQALALLDAAYRPIVTHQSGAAHIDALQQSYAQAGVEATLVPFMDEPAQAYADADLVVCRAGASTVTELAAVGVAAVLVPFPHAVDDHQRVNACYLSDANAAWIQSQADFTPQWLADFLKHINRSELQSRAEKAKHMQQIHATESIVAACQELAA